MRIYPFLFAAAVTLSAYADASATRSSLTSQRPAPSHHDEPQRFLREGAEANEEERTPDFLKTLDEMLIAEKPSDASLASFLQKYKDIKADESFAHFQLDNAHDNLLRTPQFLWWARLMQHQNSDNPGLAIAEFLVQKFGSDAAFLKKLDIATKDPVTKGLAIKLQDGWIEANVKAKIHTDKVLSHVLQLVNIDDKMLSTSRFKAWVELMELKHTNPEELEVEMAIALGNRIGDEDVFYGILATSVKDPDTMTIATRIQDGIAQVSINTGFSPYALEMFRDKDLGNVLRSPRFPLWNKFVIKVCDGDEQKAMAEMAKVMAEEFGSDAAFLKKLDIATKDPVTKGLAIKLQDGWIEANVKAKIHTDKVLSHVLQLVNIDDKMLSTSRFKAWVELMELKHTNPEELEVEMAIALGNRIGDEDVFYGILATSVKDPDTMTIATRIQDGIAQVSINTGFSPYALEMFRDKDLGNVLRSPRFPLWNKFVIKVCDGDEQKAMAEMAKVMAEEFGSDAAFLKKLDIATKDPVTKGLAIKLQDGWIEANVKAKIHTDKVLSHVLQLVNIDDKMLSTSRFKAWVELMELKHTNPEELEVEMAIALGNRIGDEDVFYGILATSVKDPDTMTIATRIQDGIAQVSINTGFSPYALEMFRDKDLGNVLRSPRFPLWNKFVIKVCDGDEQKAMAEMAKVMAEEFGSDAAFLKKLDIATKDPTTEKLATKLQDGFMNFQLSEEKSADFNV